MKKQSWFMLLVAMFTAILLCGCSQYDDKYDDEDFLTDGMNHYATTLWSGHIQTDGSYTLRAGSFSGIRSLRSFTVEENQSLCEVNSTLTGTKGQAKLLVVDTKEKTIAAQWPLDSQEPFTVTLSAGSYDLRIAGKSAGFEGEVSLALNGQALSWDDMLDAVQDVVEEAVTGELQDALQDVTDSLQQTFGDEQTAA